jgi:curved DNA-binding protein CbpA
MTQQIKRQHFREQVDFEVTIYWEHGDGQVGTCHPQAQDLSDGGLSMLSPIRIELGQHVFLDMPKYGFPLEGVIRYCVPEDTQFRIGLEFSSAGKQTVQPPSADIDYYEVLQLSPKAELETIHRVYRIMAARYHPDNPESGDQEKFLLLSDAYKVLSDPERRGQYDAMREEEPQRPLPVFQAKAFVDDKEGEANRRLGVLCLLYAQRRRDPEHPNVSLLDIEEMMGVPREHLEFTMWYLRQKRYVERTDGADCSLTADGVDYVEEHSPSNTLMMKLLHMGPAGGSGPEASRSWPGSVKPGPGSGKPGPEAGGTGPEWGRGPEAGKPAPQPMPIPVQWGGRTALQPELVRRRAVAAIGNPADSFTDVPNGGPSGPWPVS